VHVTRSKPENGFVALQPLSADEAPTEAVEKVILRRGSSRKFTHDPISFNQLSTVLVNALQPIPFDIMSADNGPLTQAYLIVNNVKGMASGKYVYHHDHAGLERMEAGVFRAQAGKLALDQNLGADASVNIYFLTSMRSTLEDLGNRGYRLEQLEAGIFAGRIYLSAYALGLGATGLTFYDDQVTKFFSPHAAEKSVMFLIAMGVPAKEKN
jgi:SagB-type dehydrogenase family enzyme